MAIAAEVELYTGPKQTGSSYVTGLAVGERYGLVTNLELAPPGLTSSLESGHMATGNSNLSLVLFNDYSFVPGPTGEYSFIFMGGFCQLSLSSNERGTFSVNPEAWNPGGVRGADSALIISSNQAGTTETRISFVETFQSQWNSLLGQALQGTPITQAGPPVLTWCMFPGTPGAVLPMPSPTTLSPDQIYLQIWQEVLINMPWYWSNYHAQVFYFIQPYVNDGRLWVYGASWWITVDPGAKSGLIYNLMAPQVANGLSVLENKLNSALAATSSLNPTDVYLLPGKQLTPLGTGPAFVGNTADDVTIVIVS
jgi:hypothetical protein